MRPLFTAEGTFHFSYVRHDVCVDALSVLSCWYINPNELGGGTQLSQLPDSDFDLISTCHKPTTTSSQGWASGVLLCCITLTHMD